MSYPYIAGMLFCFVVLSQVAYVSVVLARAGVSRCGARLETLLRGPTE